MPTQFILISLNVSQARQLHFAVCSNHTKGTVAIKRAQFALFTSKLSLFGRIIKTNEAVCGSKQR